jgi:hypothetical protein
MGRKSREKRERRAAEERNKKWGNDQMPDTVPVRKYAAQPGRSSGSTTAERHLARLCRRTFLSSWSYPNVYRGERRPDGSAQGKEVCDLLVVFENDVLIFSDKDVAFPKSDDVHKDWARWYRRAVHKSAAQLYGAERIIRAREPLFLDPKLEAPFPLALPDPEVMRVHRVLVAHGASERCRRHFGGNGTLVIQPSLVGDDHVKPAAEGGVPFALGRVDAAKGFVHVLDDASLDLLLQTLDTAPDLIAYLRRKEELIQSGRLAIAAGEEALLGMYLSDVDDAGNHIFPLPDDGAAVAVDESWWHRYINGPEVVAKRDADKISYVWDGIIERFAKHFREGTAEHLSHAEAAEHARILQYFAREGRVRRRVLAKTAIDVVVTTEPHMRRLRVIPPIEEGDPYWVFLAFPYLKSATYERNRSTRRWFLEACCLVTKLTWPDAKDIVGFASESSQGKAGRSEDALYMDLREWTPEMEAEAKRLQREYNILTNANFFEFHETEYPVDEAS